MGCARLVMADGSTGHICGPGINACVQCGFLAGYQCDYPMGNGKTCDAHLCQDHAISQGFAAAAQLRLFEDPDPETELHFCPTHAALAAGGE
jgi:hypothetical protein